MIMGRLLSGSVAGDLREGRAGDVKRGCEAVSTLPPAQYHRYHTAVAPIPQPDNAGVLSSLPMTERATDQRTRIVRAAADLLVRGGQAAVSTRAVSAAAGVQAPALY